MLLPQVVHEVAPVPVVAAGGIVDGRGLAAALALGAQGANVGTRFIASEEAELGEGYKQAVLAATSDQTMRAPFVNDLVPPASQGAYVTAPLVVRNPFVDEWHGREDDVRTMKGELAARIRAAVADGRVPEVLVIAGEVAGAIDEILPAAEIVRRMATEAEDILQALPWA